MASFCIVSGGGCGLISSPPQHAATAPGDHEALQLRFSFDVSVSCDGLVSAAPHRPGDDVSRADAALGQAHRHTPDLLNRPADQGVAWRALVFVFGGGDWLARRRTAAIIAKASITRETCRCQPCHERVSL